MAEMQKEKTHSECRIRRESLTHSTDAIVTWSGRLSNLARRFRIVPDALQSASPAAETGFDFSEIAGAGIRAESVRFWYKATGLDGVADTQTVPPDGCVRPIQNLVLHSGSVELPGDRLMSHDRLRRRPRQIAGRHLFIRPAAWLLLTFPALPLSAQDRFEQQRAEMVRVAIAGEGISNSAVLAAMRKVPRHEFVTGAARLRAYQDTALAIGSQQTISPPYIVAYMTESLDPQPSDKVLEIGTGSGYQAAVLAEIVREVYTIEIVPALAKAAERRLKTLGLDNVQVLSGDGYQGWPEHAPFDKIIVTCSPEKVPPLLLEQLREGGRMIIPVGERYQQTFHLLRKKDGRLEEERLISTLFVPMTGRSEAERRVQPDPNRPQIINGSFEADENQDGRVDGWHYQRLTEITTDDPAEGSQSLQFRNDQPGDLSQALQGTAIDGRTVGRLRVSWRARHTGIVNGPGATERAALIVHFYDHLRREVDAGVATRWLGSAGWQNGSSTLNVPPAARELIVRIGLNGATGTLAVDDVQLHPLKR